MLNVCSILQSDLIKSESLIAIRCHGKRGGKRERTIILQKKTSDTPNLPKVHGR